MSGEERRRFACFGGTVTVHVRAAARSRASELADGARRRLLDAHRRLTRFDPDSELCRLNRDPRLVVPASPLLRALATAVTEAGEISGGLVDATQIDSLERAGYRESMAGAAIDSGWEAPERFAGPRPAAPDPEARWRMIRVDEKSGKIVRPQGLRIDSGGLAKGLLADIVGGSLAELPAYSVDCCGDMRIGGAAGRPRRIRIGNPFGGEPIGELRLAEGGVATSGVARRSWKGSDGRPAHHLIDPASGEPAETGVVQATALAPTALLAEVYAKSALLAGPDGASRWLPHGGALVLRDGSAEILEPSAGGVGAAA